MTNEEIIKYCDEMIEWNKLELKLYDNGNNMISGVKLGDLIFRNTKVEIAKEQIDFYSSVKELATGNIKKGLAFDIIVKKNVDTYMFKSYTELKIYDFTYAYYKEHYIHFHTDLFAKPLTEEEFNLLNEVLK